MSYLRPVLTENIPERRSRAEATAPRPFLSTLTLLAADVVGLGVGGAVGLWVAELAGSTYLFAGWHVLIVMCIVFGAFALADLYPGAGVSPVDELRSIILILSALAVVDWAIRVGSGANGGQLVLPLAASYLAAMVVVVQLRLMLRELLSHRAWWGVPAIVLGAGQTAALIIDSLANKPSLNLKVVACLDDDPDRWGTSVAGVKVSGPVEPKALELRSAGANYAILAMPALNPTDLSALVHRLGRVFAKLVVTPNMFGMTSVGVGTRDSGAVIGLFVRGHLSQKRNLLIKRLADIVMLVPLGLVAAPIIALAAIAIMIVSPGNPFYAQNREGHKGRRMRMWKLRTMHRDADALLAKYLEENPAARAEWQTRFKLKSDPRIIPGIGSFLRRFSLDELPQLWNIAKGELSFVGPRPFPDYHLESFDADFRALRCSVLPGLTGYWQVSSRAATDLQGQIELDSYYIFNWSLWLDLYVVARTPWAVAFGEGAY